MFIWPSYSLSRIGGVRNAAAHFKAEVKREPLSLSSSAGSRRACKSPTNSPGRPVHRDFPLELCEVRRLPRRAPRWLIEEAENLLGGASMAGLQNSLLKMEFHIHFDRGLFSEF